MNLGFSGAAGFATGFASTKLGKLGIVVIGSGFMIVQGLSYLEYTVVNWNKAEHDFNYVLNKYGADYSDKLSDIVMNNIPSAAAFSTGMLLGFRMAK